MAVRKDARVAKGKLCFASSHEQSMGQLCRGRFELVKGPSAKSPQRYLILLLDSEPRPNPPSAVNPIRAGSTLIVLRGGSARLSPRRLEPRTGFKFMRRSEAEQQDEEAGGCARLCLWRTDDF